MDVVRVLVIEDEVELADALRRGLTAEGWVVDVVHDGHLGLRYARTGVYAAVLLDLMLPHLSGYKVLDRMRRAGIDTPVLVLTAKDGETDQTDALDGGADDYLIKPFRYLVLTARLRALVRRGRAGSGSGDVVQVGDLVLDTRRRRCHRGQADIMLTSREFALLEVLATRAGETVSKQELLLQAWPGEVDDVNLVEVRVSALRRKIDAPFGMCSLQTVRGHGYRLVADR